MAFRSGLTLVGVPGTLRAFAAKAAAAGALIVFTVKAADIFPTAIAADARPIAKAADIFPTATVSVEGT